MNLFWEHHEPSPLLSALARIVYGQPDGPPYPLMGPPSSVPVQYVDPMGPPYVPPPPSFFASNRADSERGGMRGPPMPDYPLGPPSDLAPMGPFASEQSPPVPPMAFAGQASPTRHRAAQPYRASAQPGFGFPAPAPQTQVNGMLGAQQPDFSLEAMLRDPSIQALLQPTPFPQMAQPPDRAMLQPHGFLESLAQSAPGILEGLGNAHPRNFGEGLLSGLVGGVTSGLARRGQETLGARQSAYQQQGDAATARNKMLADAWLASEKSRRESFDKALVEGYVERNKQANSADLIPTPPGLTKIYADAGIKLPAKITEKQHESLARTRPYPGGPFVMVPGIGPVASGEFYSQKMQNERAAMARGKGTSTITPDQLESDTNTEPPEYAAGVANPLAGVRWFDGSNYKGDDLRMLREWGKQTKTKILGKDANDVLVDINATLDNLNQSAVAIRGKLPKTWGERLTKGPANLAAAASQSDPDLAAYVTWFPSRIRALRAEAGKGGFRMTESEINRMQQYAPQITDTVESFDRKMAIQRQILNNVKRRIFGAGPAPPSGPVGVPAPPSARGVVQTSLDASGEIQVPK